MEIPEVAVQRILHSMELEYLQRMEVKREAVLFSFVQY